MGGRGGEKKGAGAITRSAVKIACRRVRKTRPPFATSFLAVLFTVSRDLSCSWDSEEFDKSFNVGSNRSGLGAAALGAGDRHAREGWRAGTAVARPWGVALRLSRQSRYFAHTWTHLMISHYRGRGAHQTQHFRPATAPASAAINRKSNSHAGVRFVGSAAV